MKYKNFLVPFPFDDLSSHKVRPAVCLTEAVQPFDHIVFAFITSRVAKEPTDTDFVIDSTDTDFPQTGLKISSTLRLHRLMTISSQIIKRELGELSKTRQKEVKKRLRKLLKI